MTLLAALVSLVVASPPLEFSYEDLKEFGVAIAEHKAGKPLEQAMQSYIDRSSPGFKAFAKAYGTNAQTLAAQVTKRPKYYESLPQLEAKLRGMQGKLGDDIASLSRLSGGKQPVPVYFLIADMKAGGTPKEVELKDGSKGFGILVAVEMMAVLEGTDKTEFPNYRGVPLPFENTRQIVVHEMTHVFQVQHQGLDAYRSIYAPTGYNTNLAVLIREGAAEFLTHLASGQRLGDRHVFGEKNAKHLFAEFDKVKHDPAFRTPGWFDGGSADRPMQIGYWLGMEVCRRYYEAAADKQAALRDLFSANTKEQFEKIWVGGR